MLSSFAIAGLVLPNASQMPTFICAGVAPLSRSGFAGLWSAAARRRDELCISPGEVEILVVNRPPLTESASANTKPS